MNAPLYSIDVLRLAAATAETPRLPAPGGTAERRSRTCGSTIVVDVVLKGGDTVAAYGHDVRACALGQASATVLARTIIGRSKHEVETARDTLAAYLDGTHDTLPDWPGMEIVARARPYPARHGAIRLPFDAAVDAIAQAGA